MEPFGKDCKEKKNKKLLDFQVKAVGLIAVNSEVSQYVHK